MFSFHQTRIDRTVRALVKENHIPNTTTVFYEYYQSVAMLFA